jgi:hypothetical protein
VYATWYYLLNGSWVPTGYAYTAFGGGSSRGVITSPVPSSTLTGSSVAFTWTAGSDATAYWIDVGSTSGGNQLLFVGHTIYVSLYSYVGGQWLNNPVTYTSGP